MPLRFSPSRGAAVVLSSSSRGPAGAAATVAAGTTTTGAEGTSAAVANAGSTSAAVLNFTIPRGAIPAIGFNFDTSTADADPGAGNFRFNNATPASVTAIYFDNVDRDGNTVTTWLDSFDDSTSTAKGTLTFTPSATPSAKLVYAVSGSIVDGTGYRKVTVTHIAGTVLPTVSAHVAVVFDRTGDKGADGSGTFPGSSTDNAVARFDGVGGTTIQNSGVIISDTNAITGVLSLATTTIELGAVSDTTLARASAGIISVEGVNVTMNSNASVHICSSIELAASDTTLSRASAGVLAVEGVTVSLNSTSATHTAGTIELGAATDTTLSRAAAGTLAVEGVNVLTTGTGRAQGKETIFIPAGAMKTRTTNGAAAGSVEQTTNKNMVVSLDFDTTTQEFAQFDVWFPKSWNLGTVTFQPSFSQLTTAAGGVVFGLAGVARSDADALDVAFGTAQTSTKTAGTANLEYIGPESAAITIAGTPAAGDRVQFQINRTVADASDTLAQDARLHGIRLFFTTNAATDA